MIDMEGIKEYFTSRNLMMVGAAGVSFFAGQWLYNAIAERFGGDETKATIFGIIGSLLAAAVVYSWARGISDIESPWKPVLYGAAVGLAMPAMVNGFGLLFRATGITERIQGAIGQKVSTVSEGVGEVIVVQPNATSTGGVGVSQVVSE